MTAPRNLSSWLPTLLGPVDLQANGASWPSRRLIWNFVGGITVTDVPNDDDDTLSYTQINLDGGGGGTGIGPTITNSGTGELNNIVSVDGSDIAGAIHFAGAAPAVSGIGTGQDKRWLVLHAFGGPLVLKNESADSTDVNRITTGTGADLTIEQGHQALIAYSPVTTRWRIVARTIIFSGAVGDVMILESDGTLIGITGADGDSLQKVSGSWTAAPVAAGANPAGSGHEMQYRVNGTTFGAVTGASSDGTKIDHTADPTWTKSAQVGTLAWTPTATRTATIPDATDTLVGKATTDTLTNKTMVAASNTLTDTGAASGDMLVHNGTKFLKASTIALTKVTSPTGGGFATVTASAWDAAATTNLRYTSGFFQTDTDLQWRNTAASNVLGNLQWAPTSTNKAIALPDANGVVVLKNTTDTLTNKSIDATTNTLTNIANAAIAAGAAIALSKLASMPGSSGQLLYNNATAIGAATGLTFPGTSRLGLGTGTLHSTARLSTDYNAGTPYTALGTKTSTAADANLVGCGTGDACSFGDTALDIVINGITGTISFSNPGSAIKMGGGTYPGQGFFQFKYNAGSAIKVLSEMDSTATPRDLIRLGPGDAFGLGATALDTTHLAATYQLSASALSITLSSVQAITASSTKFGIGVPVGGDSSVPIPFRWQEATIAMGSSGDVTATNAQAAAVSLLLTGTDVSSQNLILPDNAGDFYIIKNNSSGSRICGKSSGTGVTIANTKSQPIIHRSSASNYEGAGAST